MQGLKLKTNENGFTVAELHYTADPMKCKPEWKSEMRKGYTQAGWQREMEIDFEALSGTLVYPEYDQAVHMISKRLLDPDKIISTGTRIRVLDHGRKNPTAMIWCWIDPEDNWIIYREYYVANQTVQFHSANIKKMSEREQYAASLADPSIFAANQQSTDGRVYSISSIYADNGIEFAPANNSFLSGSDIIHERLKIDEKRIHPFTGKFGSPSIFFVREECNWLDWEIRKWRYQEFSSVKVEITKNPKESPVDKDNHILDCLTYLGNSVPNGKLEFDAPKSFLQQDISRILNAKDAEADALEDQWNTEII